jgi:hypothetical protein
VAGRDVGAALVGDDAAVVGVGRARAPHPQPAAAADEPATEQVLGLLAGRAAGCVAAAGAGVAGGLGLDLLVFVFADDGRVARRLGPDPLVGRVGLAALLAGAAVPNLVAGVLGVAEQLPDAGAAPHPQRAGGIGGDRWGEPLRVAVQQVADLGDAAGAVEVLVVDAPHDRAADRVEVQGVADLAAAGLVGVGVLVGDEPVAVAGDPAHVPALAGGGLEALAGLGHQVAVVADRDADVEVAQHDRPERLLERLICAVQPDPHLAELVLELEGDQGGAGDPVDRLADHPVERPRRAVGVVDEFVQPARAGDRDGRQGQGGGDAAVVVAGGAGLDLVVGRHDPPAPAGRGGLAVAELAV